MKNIVYFGIAVGIILVASIITFFGCVGPDDISAPTILNYIVSIITVDEDKQEVITLSAPDKNSEDYYFAPLKTKTITTGCFEEHIFRGYTGGDKDISDLYDAILVSVSYTAESSGHDLYLFLFLMSMDDIPNSTDYNILQDLFSRMGHARKFL